MGLTGCAGDGDFPTAPVTGQVLCQGQPVPHAMVYFEPLRTGKSALVGKPAFAMADENGNFVLGTYSLDDGAVIGRHRVRVDPPPPGKNSPGWTCPCEMDSNKDVMQVEVIDGENNFVIELPKASRRSRRSFDDEDEGEGDD
ncbi:MAG: hypothetical protein KatS3mg111_4207 [Pirellulaceae bacterium]|nr:MAG: hypothetical protein KatS3mg111_4207 [Pirellulaceae bacterium]